MIYTYKRAREGNGLEKRYPVPSHAIRIEQVSGRKRLILDLVAGDWIRNLSGSGWSLANRDPARLAPAVPRDIWHRLQAPTEIDTQTYS